MIVGCCKCSWDEEAVGYWWPIFTSSCTSTADWLGWIAAGVLVALPSSSFKRNWYSQLLNSFKSQDQEPETAVNLTSQIRWQYIGSCLALLVINKPDVVSTPYLKFLYCWCVEIGVLLLDFHTWHHSVEPIKAAPSVFFLPVPVVASLWMFIACPWVQLLLLICPSCWVSQPT